MSTSDGRADVPSTRLCFMPRIRPVMPVTRMIAPLAGESGKDRRVQRVSLTARGRRLVPILAQLADENDAEMFGHLTEQTRADLIELLKGIVQRHGWKDVPVD